MGEKPEADSSNSQRIPYHIVYASSEDPDYPASQLLLHTSETRGWKTRRFSPFPQDLIIGFEGPVKLSQIQFLSHQAQIATKIEIFTANPPPNQTNHADWKFTRLGYLSLDNNERSQFQARELKSVFIDAEATAVKFSFYKNHVNRHNVYNQIGIVGISISGKDLTRNYPEKAIPLNTSNSTNASNQLPSKNTSTKFDENILKDIYELREKIEKEKIDAVQNEDFEKAIYNKTYLIFIDEKIPLIKNLDDEKKSATDSDDYERALSIKNEIVKIKNEIFNYNGKNAKSITKPTSKTKVEPIKKKEISQPKTVSSQPMNREQSYPSYPTKAGGAMGGGGGSSENVCQFCKAYDDDFTDEDAYDIHLYRDCPMLEQCEDCGQIIEKNELRNHKMTECTGS